MPTTQKKINPLHLSFCNLLIMLLTISCVPLPALSSEQAPIVFANKDLNRWPDPVIIKGRLLKEMLGYPVDHLRLYAFRENHFQPIRYQIDEMTGEKGDWVLPQGPRPNAEMGNQTFDSWDTLIFMASDTGDKVTPAIWPAGHRLGKEIEIIDPLTKEKGWCYLFYFASVVPPRSPLPDYIFYEYETETLHTDYMYGQTIITENGEHSNYYRTLYIPKTAGGNEKTMVDRLKLRVTIKLFFGAMTLYLSEGNVKGDTLAYKTGPVRLIRRLEQYILLPGGIKVLRAVADINQYRNIGNCPAIFQLPFRMDRLVSSFKIRFGTDYSPHAFGCKVFNSSNPAGFLVDGRMSQAEQEFNPVFDNWRLLTGDIGTFMSRTLPLPEVKKHVNITMGIIDDIDQYFPPEKYPGTIGYLWQDWDLGKAPKGRYILFLEFYWIPNYQPGDEINYLNYQDHPLRIQVDSQAGVSQSLIIPTLCKKYN